MLFRKEGEPVGLRPATVLLEGFWQAAAKGEAVRIPLQEIKRLVDEVFFAGEPLAPLKIGDEKFLREYFYERLEDRLNSKWFFGALSADPVVYLANKVVCEKEIYSNDGRQLSRFNNEPFLVTQSAAVDAVEKGHSALSYRDKIILYTDPTFSEKTRMGTDSIGSCPTRTQGSRGFFARWGKDSYGFDREKFASLTKAVSKRVARKNLRFLDVGGLMGKACDEVRNYYSNFEFTNITVDEELAMWPGIRHVFVPAERFPASFKEGFDIIVGAYNAFRHFAYADLAVINVVHALNVGGVANICYYFNNGPWVSVPGGMKRLEIRAEQMFSILRKWQSQGVIDFTFKSDELNKWEGLLEMTKKKSVPRRQLF